jgi:hypothetical protein
MQKYILRRKMIYTETAEIEVENWEAAKLALRDENTVFETNHDDQLHDESIEFCGDINEQ